MKKNTEALIYISEDVGVEKHIVTWRLKAETWRFAKHIPLATLNRPLLDNGLENTHSRGNGYGDYNR
jgi:hypothetical protein